MDDETRDALAILSDEATDLARFAASLDERIRLLRSTGSLTATADGN